LQHCSDCFRKGWYLPALWLKKNTSQTDKFNWFRAITTVEWDTSITTTWFVNQSY
jgi:hypothetical protein